MLPYAAGRANFGHWCSYDTGRPPLLKAGCFRREAGLSFQKFAGEVEKGIMGLFALGMTLSILGQSKECSVRSGHHCSNVRID